MTEDPVLLDRLKTLLGSDTASTSFVVKNLQTNRGASFNPNQSYYPASLFKLFVMFEVFHQEALGVLKPDVHLVMTPYYDDFGLTPRQTTLCQHLTVDTALDAMMSVSDNAAAVLLQDVVGSPNVNDSMAALGLTATKLISEDLETSAGDLALLLEGIARRQAVSPAASDAMIRLMSSEQFDNGLRAGVPDNVMVAHKTGNYDGFTNDAGLVFAPNGTYLVVVLSEADDAQFVTKELSRTVYDYFTKGP